MYTHDRYIDIYIDIDTYIHTYIHTYMIDRVLKDKEGKAGRMAQQVKVPATKLDNPRSVLSTDTVEQESKLSQIVT